MESYLESKVVIDAIIRCSSENGISEDGLNQALLSMLNSSMRAGRRDEHTLCNNEGELLLLVQRFG